MFKIKLSNMLIESSPPPSVATEVHGAPQGNSVTVTEDTTNCTHSASKGHREPQKSAGDGEATPRGSLRLHN